MSLPFLPGNTFSNPRKTDFRKAHFFDKKAGHATVKPTPIDPAQLDALSERLMKQTSMVDGRAYDPSLTFGARVGTQQQDTFVPAFVALDGKQLHFDAYFTEAVEESALETHRVRRVKIHYFLEDDSISVTEHYVPNSGLPQGTLLRRHRIPNQREGRFYTAADLTVGSDVVFYARTYHITDASDFTREYMASIGVQMGPAEPVPADPYTSKRELALSATQRVSHADPGRLKLKRFLETGGKVLRFYCVWDDRDSMFGEVRPLVLHFFLADDTAEVLEVHRNNSGRDPFPVFMRRRRLPKSMGAVVTESEQDGDFYTAKDLVIGETINVLGRNLLLYDADESTKQYYRDHFGVTQFNVITQVEEKRSAPQREIPPPTGFGTDEDSLASFFQLIPKPPRKDFKKMMTQDGKVLRFAAKLVTDRPEDADRRFTISYFLADDTLLIFEPPQRNSGIWGGKFLERSRVRNDNTGEFFKPSDLRIGAQLTALRRTFVLYDADEFALKYMEEHPDQFPESDIARVLAKCREAAKQSGLDPAAVLGASDPSGTLTPDELQPRLAKLTGGSLSPQEVVTLFRRFDTHHDGLVNAAQVAAAIRG